MEVTINGEPRRLAAEVSLETLLRDLKIDPKKVAVERNLEIVPRSTYGLVQIASGDRLEIVHFIGGGAPDGTDIVDEGWTVAGRHFNSRLLVGTGRYKDFEETAAALKASGAEIVTVAVRRVNISDPTQPMLVDYVSPKDYTYLPNTAGCYTADEAVRTLRLAREAGGWSLVKLEVLGDQKSLFPDMVETLKAAEILVKDGFDVMAPTIRSWPDASRISAVAPSCRSVRRSARASASRTRSISA